MSNNIIHSIITKNQLFELGFYHVQPLVTSDKGTPDEFSYNWHRFTKNEINLDITTEYDKNMQPTKQYISTGSEDFKGRPATPTDIKLIQELM